MPKYEYIKALGPGYQSYSSCPLKYTVTGISQAECLGKGYVYDGNTVNYQAPSQLCEVRECGTKLNLSPATGWLVFVNENLIPKGWYIFIYYCANHNLKSSRIIFQLQQSESLIIPIPKMQLISM